MGQYFSEILLETPDATADFARQLGTFLMAGDVVGLSGPLGAGKSHFARALIQSRQELPEDVPSPSFTLVQTYEAGGLEIWHCDLYRLTSAEEAWELGLDEAFENALCLIEWPERLGGEWPDEALTCTFAPGETAQSRVLHLSGGPHWAARLAGFVA